MLRINSTYKGKVSLHRNWFFSVQTLSVLCPFDAHILAVVLPLPGSSPLLHSRSASTFVLVVKACIMRRSSRLVLRKDLDHIVLDEEATDSHIADDSTPFPAIDSLDRDQVTRRLHKPVGTRLHDIQVCPPIPTVVEICEPVGLVLVLVVEDLHMRITPGHGGPLLCRLPGQCGHNVAKRTLANVFAIFFFQFIKHGTRGTIFLSFSRAICSQRFPCHFCRCRFAECMIHQRGHIHSHRRHKWLSCAWYSWCQQLPHHWGRNRY